MIDFSRVTLTFAMPRSRSQWLAWIFRESGIAAWHDPLVDCTSPSDLVRKVRSHLHHDNGPLLIVDTGAIFFHNQLRAAMREAKPAYLLRNPIDCALSFERHTGRNVLRQMNEQNDRMYRYAFGEGCTRMFFGLVDQRIGDFWNLVDGKPMPRAIASNYPRLRDTIVDTPPHKQRKDHYKSVQLSRYVEQ